MIRHAFVVLAVFAPSMAFAQDLRLEERPRPETPEGSVTVPPRHESPAPPASGVPARDVRVEHDPAFIPPFVGAYQTPTGSGQYGLSGWTSPNAPVDPASGEISGWFSFGFSLTWDGKPPSPATVVR
jgi:hypothetical protein